MHSSLIVLPDRVPASRGPALPQSQRRKLRELWRLTGDENIRRIYDGRYPRGMTPSKCASDRRDAISSCLMTTFKETGVASAFELLIEMNRASLRQAVLNTLRGNIRVDADDAMQETYLNICRYRASFRGDKPAAFRTWAHRIAINTAIRLFKAESRHATQSALEDIAMDTEDPSAATPLRSTSEAESSKVVDFAYLLYLHLYLSQYLKLSAREQRALTLVQIEGASYKATAADLGIRLESVKMLIFRARRRIAMRVDRELQKLRSRLAAEDPAGNPPADPPEHHS